MPDLFDAIDLDTAPLGECGLGQPRRNPDAQAAGDEFQERPAPGRIERVEPRLEQASDFVAARRLQLFNDLAQARDGCLDTRCLGPDQRHGLGEVADKIIGPSQELGVDPCRGECPHLARFCRIENQLAGQGGQCPAPFGIGLARKILLHQPQLAVARWGEQQRVEEGCEAVHVCPSPCASGEREGPARAGG